MESAGTSTLVVTPAGESPIAPGVAETGALLPVGGGADDDAVPPPCEQPANTNAPAAATTAPRGGT